MSFPVMRNAWSSEGTLVSGTPTIDTFPWNSRQVILTNDSANNHTVKLGNGPSSITVKAGETLSANLWIGSVTLTGVGAYRLWVFG